jgi:hypothetical protein
LTSLKESARKAFLEEPPFPNSTFEKFAESYIKELEKYLILQRDDAVHSTRMDLPYLTEEEREIVLGFLRGGAKKEGA